MPRPFSSGMDLLVWIALGINIRPAHSLWILRPCCYSKLPAKQPSFGCSIQPATRLPFIFGTDCNHCFDLTARAPTSHPSLAYACLLAQTAPSSVSFRRSLRVHPQALHSHPRIPSASQPPSLLTSPAERVIRLHRSGPLIPHLHTCPPYHASSHMVPAVRIHVPTDTHTKMYEPICK
ncbi:uncharacterized protein IWZ02DRAFT_259829 [Phyllosticta citriasiana]|uniref:uncharacterized protein n=1 Tax=Phyllosticta citriasiana TaxID=595635 RepID=UPI0030FD5145